MLAYRLPLRPRPCPKALFLIGSHPDEDASAPVHGITIVRIQCGAEILMLILSFLTSKHFFRLSNW